MKRTLSIIVFLLVSICLFFFPVDVEAQCAMCKAAAESNLEAGGTAGKGLNSGILFMLAMPYILVATVGILWYRNRRRQRVESEV